MMHRELGGGSFVFPEGESLAGFAGMHVRMIKKWHAPAGQTIS